LLFLVIMLAATVAFVVNNFRELPAFLIVFLVAAVPVFGAAIWKKWPTLRTLSKPKELQSYLEPWFRLIGFPVVAAVLFIIRALPFETPFGIIEVIFAGAV
jgi:hypothetical protein